MVLKFKHEDTKRHKRYANYIPGSGCDKCCLTFAELRIIFKNWSFIHESDMRVLYFHRKFFKPHSGKCNLHHIPEITKPGACSICNHAGVDDHFTSFRHKQTEKIMENILRNQMTRFKKGARK